MALHKYLLIILICIIPLNGKASVFSDSVAMNIQLRTYVEQKKVPFNREVVYHVVLQWQGEITRYKISELVEPDASGLAVRGSGSSNKVINNPDGTTQSVKMITFYFKPLEIGMAYIDGLVLRYEDTQTLQKESLIASRLGVEIIEPVPEPAANGSASIVVVAAFAIFIIAASIYFFLRYRSRKNKEKLFEQAAFKETVEDKYLRLLKDTIHSSQENLKEGMSDLTQLLNGYFSEKYKLTFSGYSEAELLNALNEKGFPEDSTVRVKDLFEAAHLVKFAGEQINNSDFHRYYDTVELVLQNQKQNFSQEENK